ncbi:MAG: hypothetical protein P4L83_09105 [Nevskia sp.]|nr:hypothetical protein [Nevskia sp.]
MSGRLSPGALVARFDGDQPKPWMPLRSKIVVATAAANFVVLSVFTAYKSPLLQAISLLLFLSYLCACTLSMIEPIRGWRVYRFRTFIPLAACLAAWYGSFWAGPLLLNWLFAHNLPRFQAIVDGIRPESLPSNGDLQAFPIDQADKSRVQHIFARKAADGALVVEIDTENGFPVKHAGYVFSSSGVFPSDRRFQYRWPYVDELRPKWFRVCN